MDEIILAKNLPGPLIESTIQRLAAYTIAFLRIGAEAKNPPADLIGSGVLVSAGARRAILTANHVAEVLPKSGRICLFLNRTSQPHTVACDGVVSVKVARGHEEARGPDLSVIILSPPVAGSIASIKSFFNLDNCRDQLLNDPPPSDLGAWFAHGFLDERTTVGFDRTEPDLTKYFYNFTGVGAPGVVEQLGKFDYFDLRVSDEARSEVPTRWGGMSGGGVWQVPFKRVGAEIVDQPALLSGLMFYQHPTTPTSCGVRCHGRLSLYQSAFSAITGEP